MRIHFDADLLVYRCGFAAEKTHYYVVDEFDEEYAHFQYSKDAKAWMEKNPGYTLTSRREAEPVSHALRNVKLMVNDTLEALGASESDATLYLTGSTNYRDGVATIKPYKGNRDKAPKPVHGPAIREYMKENYDVNVSEDEEADDVVGYEHYKLYLRDPHSSCIVTVDKDIDMIPGLHYNFVKEESYYVDDDQADRYFYLQLLKGDSTDNIPGLPGVGDKRAAAMLEGLSTVDSYYAVARKAYDEKYEDGLAALIENARLLWIRRYPHEWWQPPVEEDMDDGTE